MEKYKKIICCLSVFLIMFSTALFWGCAESQELAQQDSPQQNQGEFLNNKIDSSNQAINRRFDDENLRLNRVDDQFREIEKWLYGERTTMPVEKKEEMLAELKKKYHDLGDIFKIIDKLKTNLKKFQEYLIKADKSNIEQANNINSLQTLLDQLIKDLGTTDEMPVYNEPIQSKSFSELTKIALEHRPFFIDGQDVLINEEFLKKVFDRNIDTNFIINLKRFGEPYVSNGNKQNRWLVNGPVNLEPYKLIYSQRYPGYWRAKSQAGVDFQLVFLMDNQFNDNSVIWARLEEIDKKYLRSEDRFINDWRININSSNAP